MYASIPRPQVPIPSARRPRSHRRRRRRRWPVPTACPNSPTIFSCGYSTSPRPRRPPPQSRSRWRSPLWRSSGAVNLETVVEEYDPISSWGWEGDKRVEFNKALFFSRRDAFVSAAEAALDAADVPVTRLTLRLNFMGSYVRKSIKFLHYGRDGSWSPDRHSSLSPDRNRPLWPDRARSRSPDRDCSPDIEGSRSDGDLSPDQEGSHCSVWSGPDRRRPVQTPARTGTGSDRVHPESPSSDRDWLPDQKRSEAPDPEVLGKLLSHRAARRVEELRIVANDSSSCNTYAYDDEKITSGLEGIFRLSLGSLPSRTLRVLELIGCKDLVPLRPASALVFPQLSSLRLCHCTAQLSTLQGLMDAAPALTGVHLEFIIIAALLRCPAATVMVLEGCYWKEKNLPRWDNNKPELPDRTVEIDAPRLRCFTYKGRLRPFSLSPQPLDLAREDLHFVPRHSEDEKKIRFHSYQGPCRDPCRGDERDLVTFWRFLRSFTTTKELNLRLNALEHIAVLSKARRIELLPTFRRLERLNLRGLHRPKGMTAAVAIANLLRCCPSLSDLQINLTLESHDPEYRYSENRFLERKFRSDRDKSKHLVDCRRNSPNAYYDDSMCGEATEIPASSRRLFDCLQSSMKRVGLQFRLDDANCFGVKLIKFFVDNAMVLHEMYIDVTKIWISNSSIKRKPGASSFVVVPIKR
ncbi:hypothetical protein VPH35_062693 [Triticum aestivum]